MGALNLSAGYMMCAIERQSLVNYTRPLLEIEQDFDHCRAFTWLSANWKLCYPFIGAYLVAIYAGRKWMAQRPPFQLRRALLIWNVALASFSIVATWRMVPAVAYSIWNYGLMTTSCTPGQLEQRQAYSLWLFLFILSKIVEFGDTAFIVLRKTPLIFLHWYHHITVAFFVWSSGAYASPMQIYFSTLNLLVHSFMYSYYAVKGMGLTIPKSISMAITSLQLLQMVVGMVITSYMFYVRVANPTCFVPDQCLAIASVIYGSYFVLFLNFFRKTYGGRKAAFIGNSKKLT